MDVLQTITLTSRNQKKESEFWNTSLNSFKINQIVKRQCNGLIVSYDNNVYVITCRHFVKDYIEIYGDIILQIAEKSIKTTIELEEYMSLIPYDLSILTIKSLTNLMNLINFTESRNEKILLIKSLKNMTQKMCFSLKSLKDRKLYLNPNKIHCEYVGSQTCDFGTNLFPEIPAININIQSNTNSHANYEGLSGSILCCKSYIYGIVSYLNDNNIVVLPAYCLHQFFLMMVKKHPLEGLYIKTKICDFDDKVGHAVVYNYDISYKNAIQNKDQNKDQNKHQKTKISFNNGDLIYKVDDKQFTNEGKLFLNQMDMDVKFDTYVMLNDFMKDMKIEMYTKNGDEEKEYDKKIEYLNKVNLYKYLLFDIEQNYDYIEYNGLIIIEFSESMFSYYHSKKINFVGTIDAYSKNFITTENMKPVVIIHITDYNCNEKYKEIGLPFVKANESKNDNNYYLSVITKCNDIKIKDLNHLKYLLQENRDVTLKISLDTRIGYNLTYPAVDKIISSYDITI